jgi:methionyl-tRNA formyltransferase
MARLLEKRDGALDFSESARRVHDRVRGMSPWPSAYACLGERTVKVWKTRVVDEDGVHGAPGEVLRAKAGIEVACGRGVVAVEELQLEGKRRMDAATFLAGNPLPEHARFSRRTT